MVCINTSSVEYQTLKQRSGLPDLLLSGICSRYEEEYGRWPELDELPYSNSSESIATDLELRVDNTVSTQQILDTVKANSVQEATIKLNDIYRDKEINVLELGKTSVVQVEQRPLKCTPRIVETGYEQADYVHNRTIFGEAINKLSNLYGIQFKNVSTEEIEKMDLKIPGVTSAKGFIYNGEIYINTDLSTVDTKLHEMMHLLIGSIRFQNPGLYSKILEAVITSSNFADCAEMFPNRSRNDVAEEVLVTQMSRFLTDPMYQLNVDGANLKYETFYNIGRMLDSILMGAKSVASLDSDVTRMSLRQLAEQVNSSIMNQVNMNSMIQAQVHRQLNNKKRELMESQRLKEIC